MEMVESSGAGAEKQWPRFSPAHWLSWLLGIALLSGLLIAVLDLSEERNFLHLAAQVRTDWLIVALILQAATYLAQGEIWRRIAKKTGFPLTVWTAYKFSLAKLFVDQALPTSGVSGTIVVAKALQERRMPRPTVVAGVLINTASFCASYTVGLLAILLLQGHNANVTVAVISGIFIIIGIGLTILIPSLAGKKLGGSGLAKHQYIRNALRFLEDADPQLSRDRFLLGLATVLQVITIVLDAATLWVLIKSLGFNASVSGVFMSFMFASLVRSAGIVPGGLGTFEATCVWLLSAAGVSVSGGLAATLLFRGLSFFLPMIPGFWLSKTIASRDRREEALPTVADYWTLNSSQVLDKLHSSEKGLSSEEAQERLIRYGRNELKERRTLSRLRVIWAQLRNPLLLLLVFAAALSAISKEWIDALIVLLIVFASTGIGYAREYSAQSAVAALQARVRAKSKVMRDGQPTTVAVEEIVPGDVVLLSAGSLVPADGVLLESTDCFVSEAALTGESFPVEKRPGMAAHEAPLSGRINCVFLGTNVRSGSARCIAVATGRSTQFGSIAHRLMLRPPETEFDRGIRRFGYFLTRWMFIIVLLVFLAHMLQHRPPVETLLFAVALAVGLSPELLPAILSVNLARGAQLMASRGVLVRRLSAIENLGSMNILCTDKTGTLTEGVISLENAYDASGVPSSKVLEITARNAALQAGLTNPLDEAILKTHQPDLNGLQKLAEIPFDFTRKRLSVVVQSPAKTHLITKGAFHHVLETCTRLNDGSALDAAGKEALEKRYTEWSSQGIRVIAVAEREIENRASYSRNDEHEMKFSGFLTFLDRPKKDVSNALTDLSRLGVSVKLITGDNKLVAQHIAGLVGLHADRTLTGEDLDNLHDEALWRLAEHTDLFVEVDPNQKERIILSLKKMGHVVGFLGDGVNDAPAMHAADTSLSVEDAVDVARDAADFVLLQRDLDVIRGGIEEGRKTFANTLKYIQITTSANLGNMLSMAAASLFLPFLPLLAGQILLNNFLSDIPAVGIADDSVDQELVTRPRRWDIRFIGRFMIVFGLLSSLFDFLTFGALLKIFRAAPEEFRTGWFIESLLTELVIALIVRTRRPFYQSRPGRLLFYSTLILIAFTFLIPFLPFADFLGFVPLPLTLLLALGVITLLYVGATEAVKKWFYMHEKS